MGSVRQAKTLSAFVLWAAQAALMIALSSISAMASDSQGVTLQATGQGESDLIQKPANPAIAMPASQHELWKRLLILLAEDHGYTPKERVEAVLGIRFTHMNTVDIETEGLGRFRASLWEDRQFTLLNMGWGRGRHCLSLEEATKDLHRLGWVSGELYRDLKTGVGQLEFWLPDEAAYARAHGIDMSPPRSQGWSRLYLLPINYQSDCVNIFRTRVWRTLLHQQSRNTDPQ